MLVCAGGASCPSARLLDLLECDNRREWCTMVGYTRGRGFCSVVEDDECREGGIVEEA